MLFAFFGLIASMNLQAQGNCVTNNELQFENAQFVSNLNAWSVDVYWKNPPTAIDGINFRVDIDNPNGPNTGVSVLLPESNATLNPIFSNFNAPYTLSSFNGQSMTMSKIHLTNPLNLTSGGNPLFLFTLFFQGAAPNCYDLTFDGSGYLFPINPGDPIDPCTLGENDTESGLCFEAITISGVIERPTGASCEDGINAGIPGVEVQLDGASPCVTMTDSYGDYECDVSPSELYQITPLKSDNKDCGVTSLDIIILRKHILYIQPLVHPYQFFAADMNKSGTLSGLDIVAINKTILGSPLPPSYLYWDFVPTSYYGFLPDPVQLLPSASIQPFFPYENFIVVNNVSQSVNQQDFIGIKMGDLNGSCDECGDGSESEFQNRSTDFANERINLNFPEKRLSKGEIYTFEVEIQNEDIALDYYQLALNISEENFEILDARDNHDTGFNYHISDENPNRFKCNWLDIEDVINFEKSSVISITLRAKKEIVNIKDAIKVDWEWSHGFDDKYSFYHFENSNLSNNLAAVVAPNPANKNAKLTINGLEKGQTSVEIFDVSGKSVFVYQKQAEDNYLEIPFHSIDFPLSGLYFYRISNELQSINGKFIWKN